MTLSMECMMHSGHHVESTDTRAGKQVLAGHTHRECLCGCTGFEFLVARNCSALQVREKHKREVCVWFRVHDGVLLLCEGS